MGRDLCPIWYARVCDAAKKTCHDCQKPPLLPLPIYGVYARLLLCAGKEQIELLSRTTVLVSTIGSRSFRLIYLPDGAQMIIVSPPVWQKPDGSGTFPLPFDETDRCWGFLGYVSVLRYHSVMGPVSERPESEAGDYIKARDKTVTLETEQFLPVVRHALDSVLAWDVPDFSSGRGY